MRFVRASKEADCPLHIHTLKFILPYFAAAGHCHYLSYASVYSMKMTNITQKSTQKGFRWGTCHVASKRHMKLDMVRHDDRNHCHAIWAWPKWNGRTNVQ